MSPLAPGRRAALVVGTVLSVGLIAIGVLNVVGWMAQSRYQQELTLRSEVKVLTVRTGGGDVSVSPSTDDLVHVTESVRYGVTRPTLVHTATAAGVLLQAGCGGWWFVGSCSVDYAVAVPGDFVVDVRSGGGSVSAAGLAGSVRLESGGGDVRASELAGRVELETGGGSVRGNALRGTAVTARTGGGNVDLVFAGLPDQVVAESGGGDVTVAVPGGAAYRVSATSGGGRTSIGVRTDPGAARSIEARSGGGDVQVVPTGGAPVAETGSNR
ncbi:MAG TPA: DUF4097 family beta strand repeat-containing protein [Mycobacteriales bacterium]|nr:DUF4097 family beta strand repeat-containing protein [Mycobacteriales bacterium]